MSLSESDQTAQMFASVVTSAEPDAALLKTVSFLFLRCAAMARRVAQHVALAVDSAVDSEHSETRSNESAVLDLR